LRVNGAQPEKNSEICSSTEVEARNEENHVRRRSNPADQDGPDLCNETRWIGEVSRGGLISTFRGRG